MYQPALPSIATSLNITTAQVQLTSPSDGSSSLSTAIRFGMSLGGGARNPVEVAAWMSEAFHKAARDSIAGDHPIGMVPARTGIRTS